ncbi:putative membrane protein [Motilibacter peucedani]|uniref:Putative membrane protein n=1 Tax=Motilibacter peucedani TaxID=598650 RepID=A0A420XPI7_9ACTN|nr:carotenoid biosynthesis protein [Motilibacter peucedani]RKS74094.1 putative membrane protein [Motilibacter peucedani]
MTVQRALPAATRLPWTLLPAAAVVLLQVAYPLTPEGTAQDRLTVATVCVFFAAVLADAAVQRGARWAATYAATTLAVGLGAEAVGVATGYPFGDYSYAGSLGPKLLDVPLVIPLAWAMFAYPALVVGRRVGTTRAGRVGAATLALASWDLFLDPQMVDAGHWTWVHPDPALPGVPGIPVTNVAGWLLVAAVLMALLDRLLPDARRTHGPVDELVPAVLFLWTWVGSTLAAAAFFGRPSVALVGGVVMGLVAVPFVRSLVRDAR